MIDLDEFLDQAFCCFNSGKTDEAEVLLNQIQSYIFYYPRQEILGQTIVPVFHEHTSRVVFIFYAQVSI